MSEIGSDELLLLEAAIVRIEAPVIRQRNKPASKAHPLRPIVPVVVDAPNWCQKILGPSFAAAVAPARNRSSRVPLTVEHFR